MRKTPKLFALATLAVAWCASAQTPVTNTWTGAVNNDASEPGNWLPQILPDADCHILLTGDYTADMLWDCDGGGNGLPDTVASWTQEAEYTGTVTFPTTCPDFDTAFTTFTISGGAAVMGGVWTHPANSETAANTAEHRLNVRVEGGMALGASGTIDVRDRGYFAGCGPGSIGTGPGTTWGGANMAGEGWWERGQPNVTTHTYGLVRTPFALGSGGGWNGGGAVWLEVDGALVLDGLILADGVYTGAVNPPWNGMLRQGGSSGGSIYVKAGTLSGAGTVSANGSQDTWDGAGSGGRIALVSASPLPGGLTCRAFGVGNSGAGTVFYSANGAAGLVMVDNSARGGTLLATHLPAARVADQGEDLSLTDWVVVRKGIVKLQADARVNSLTLGDDTAQLNLNGHVLALDAFDINGTAYPGGFYTTAGLDQVSGAGWVNVGGFSIVTNGPPELVGADVTAHGGVVRVNGLTSLLLFYGETDGADVPGAWDDCLWLDTDVSTGPASHTFIAPSGDQLAYRFAVSNEAGIGWASVSSVQGLAAINVEATVKTADKSTGAAGQFKISRPSTADASQPVSVNIAMSGTAQNGVDYALVQSPVVIPVGGDHALVDITPMGKWNLSALDATLTIGPGLYVVGANAADTVAIAATVPPSGYNVFLGGDAADSASWSGGLPADTDDILLSPFADGSNLLWDTADGLPASVASWTQTNYNGAVTFATTCDPGLFPVLTINGDVLLHSGKWTHTANGAAAEWRLNVRVKGDMELGPHAAIDVLERGYACMSGPGFTPGFTSVCMAGEALCWRSGETVLTRTYGLVRTPCDLASGSNIGENSHLSPGAGAVWLKVDGHLTLDGIITADGLPKPDNFPRGGGASGGSIYVKAGTLSGAGVVTAKGGMDGWNGPGSGGRIAVVTASELPGDLTIRAYGDRMWEYLVSGAGTIFLGQNDLAGTVVVDNNQLGNDVHLATHLPAARVDDQDENLLLTDWVARRNGVVTLQAGVKINSFTLGDTSARLNLNGHTLRLFHFTNADGVPFKTPGVYTENNLEGAFDNVDFNGGAIAIGTVATLFLLR